MAKKSKLMSIKDYAEKNRVSERTIYNRIDDGDLTTVEVSGTMLIDVLRHPVINKKKKGRPLGSVLAASL